MSENTREIRFQAENITCLSCAADMEKILRDTKGILTATVNFKDETVHVSYDAEMLDRKQVFAAVRRLGYPLRLLFESE
jgi:P-type Cu+ transporter